VSTYPILTLDSAPALSRPALETLQKNLGLIPNLAATMAASPTLINGFLGAFANFHNGTFSAADRQVLLLSNAVTNRSPWAVAFHSTAALREGVDAADVNAIRAGRAPNDPKLAVLSAFTKRCIETRGRVDAADLAAFIGAGHTHEQTLEVLAGIAVSAMANYAGNITKPAVEAPFKAQEWQEA
jgi:alkylhydroperoxidase family enzyme